MTLHISPRTLVEAFLPLSGESPLNLVYDTANHVGVSDQPVRLAIRRLIAGGEVVQIGRGRSGTLHLTDTGRQRLLDDRQALALAHAQDSGKAPWDRKWRLTAVSIPEQNRSARDYLRRHLTELGAALISTGLYVSPHELKEALSPDTGQWLVTATTEDLDLHGITDAMGIAESLWPAQQIVARYRDADDDLKAATQDPTMTTTVRRLYLAQAYESAMRHDPLIPVELRDGRWEPAIIRRAWARLWDEWSHGDASRIYQGWDLSN